MGFRKKLLRSSFLKRVIDITGAAAGLTLLSPILLTVAGLVRWQMGSPVLFRQKRGGLNHQEIEIFKFRTMKDLYDEHGVPLPDVERITALGAFLRKTSLDELPELLNVLTGSLSLVGPRPLLYRYIERYSPEQSRRHDVKPGITGWAQVNGRNAISWEEKFELDVWYIDNWDVLLDLSILVKTVLITLQRKDVDLDESTTMTEFMGSQQDSASPPPTAHETPSSTHASRRS